MRISLLKNIFFLLFFVLHIKNQYSLMLILYNEEFMKLFFQEYARVYRQIINDVNRILKPYGLTSVLWRIFLYLEKHGTAKASHIYEYYSMDKGMTSRYIAKLRAGGFVEYIEQNGKIKKILQLTETGHQLFKEINVKIREHEKDVLSILTPEEQNAIMVIIEKLRIKTSDK